jgi:hypothetical protein
MAVNGCSCREPFCPKCWPAPTASSEMSRLMDKCVELTAENQRLREALSDIAETETDWRYGVVENMQAVRDKACIALQEG